MAKIPVGVQLYTLRNETAADFVGTLKKVAGLGFVGVEFAGYGGLEAKELRNVLDGLGLQAFSSHVGIDALQNDLDATVAYNKEIGVNYLICPWLPTERFTDPAQFAELVETFRKVGQACKAQGMTFAYHNHDFEFAKVDGRYLLDVLYEGIPADVLQAELDLYWVTKGGLDPKEYLLKYSGRVPLVHVKDMDREDRSFAEVGYGSIDYKSIFEVAPGAGVKYYIVEQDVCKRPPLESIKMSIEYLKSIGIA